MFVKFGDNTPSIEVKNANKTCPECGSAVVLVNNKYTCKCNVETHSADDVVDLFTQKMETANNEK